MQYFELGKTGLKVSELCFGTLPMGPLQVGLTPEIGGRLILAGLEHGINFIDTAEIYQTNAHIKWALERFTGEVVLASKAGATTYQEMRNAVEKARNELGREVIEIFNLHAARDPEALQNRAGALEALLEYRKQGIIKAVGISTHSVLSVSRAAIDPRIEVIFALINRTGIGILDGGAEEMTAALETARLNEKGIYAMKAFGGGNLLDNLQENLNYVRERAEIPVIAVGMIREAELEMNLALFDGKEITSELLQATRQTKKAKVTGFCLGCGKCVELCHNNAIALKDGRAEIDIQHCLLCGYCSRECPQFAIRVV